MPMRDTLAESSSPFRSKWMSAIFFGSPKVSRPPTTASSAVIGIVTR